MGSWAQNWNLYDDHDYWKCEDDIMIEEEKDPKEEDPEEEDPRRKTLRKWNQKKGKRRMAKGRKAPLAQMRILKRKWMCNILGRNV